MNRSKMLLALAVLLTASGVSFADPILPGYDLLSTPPGGAVFNPSRYGLGPDVNIPMQGRPIGPGNTDTIVQRLGGLPDGGTGAIPAELVALSLESITPVPLGASFFDVFVDLNPSTPSLGQINVLTHVDPVPGGTFDSFFDVFARVTLTDVQSGQQMTFLVHDVLEPGPAPNRWSHTPPPLYPSDANYPAGGWYPAGPVTHTGPHPNALPSVPEPSSIAMAGFGLAGLAFIAVRRRRSR